MEEQAGPEEEKDERGLTLADRDRVIEMAWEDRTPFSAIEVQFGLSEREVIDLMRAEMKASSFRMWRRRVQGRRTKHRALRELGVGRFRSRQQRVISYNKGR